MHDLVIAVLAAFAGGLVVHVAHRIAAADAAADRPAPPVVPAYWVGTDALDMPAIYQRAGLPGKEARRG